MEEAAKCVHEPRRPAVTAEKVPRGTRKATASGMPPPNLRFITQGNETMDVLQETDSPNYIVVDENGRLTLVKARGCTAARQN